MRLAISLLILGAIWILVAVWDAATLAWAPRTLWYFVDVPQMLYVALPALLVTGIVQSWRTTTTGMALALGLLPEAEKAEVVKGGRALRFLGEVAMWGGIAVSLIELIVSAHNAASLAAFLPALGVAALGVFYGLLIRVACELGVQFIKIRLGPFVYYSE